MGRARSRRGHDIWRSGPLPASAQEGPPPDGLEHDRSILLRAAGAAVAEDDRDLDDLEAVLDRAVGHLDLEGVAAGADRIEVDRLQHLAPEALEAAGEVAPLAPQDESCVGAAAAADPPPQRA